MNNDMLRACPACPVDAAQPVIPDTVQETNRAEQPPAGQDLRFARFEVWHNTPGKTKSTKPHNAGKAKSTKPEWQIKMYSVGAGTEFEPDLTCHILPFSSSTTALRKRLRRMIQAGTLDRVWGEEFIAETHHMNAQARVAVFESPKGVNAMGRAWERYYSILHLTPGGDAPARLRLCLGDGDPIEIATWEVAPQITQTGKPRSAKASQWIAYYDPTGVYKQAWQETQRLRETDRRAHYDRSPNPITQWAALADEHIVAPLLERLTTVETALASPDAASNQHRQMMQHVFGLIEDNRNQAAQITSLTKSVEELTRDLKVLRREVMMAHSRPPG